MMEWFMCAFSRTLPWASVLRVSENDILCGFGGVDVHAGTRDKLKACPGQYETMEVLRAIEPRYMQEGFLVLQVLELQVSAQDVEREQRTQLKRWKKKHGEPGPKLPQRMHSARAIIATKPHTHQDLRQKPTIMVQYPSVPEEKSEPNLRKKRGSLKKNQALIPNPYALPGESKPSQILDIQLLNQENLNLVLPNTPSHPPRLPTMQENQVEETSTSTERLVQRPRIPPSTRNWRNLSLCNIYPS
ncbi:TBC1 domain family member 10A-like isoform X2 [Ictalurus punctatus]|uniref:TBC1 domain family member 10A-like isoform X2 n=1 Tax=Ictalurus punctatus TaxID=7998 RepID=A0A9F7R7W6_ICTPU|nr:TBC1 domain family member 10A-like isoform X2 [Ictalurus punctatus]